MIDDPQKYQKVRSFDSSYRTTRPLRPAKDSCAGKLEVLRQGPLLGDFRPLRSLQEENITINEADGAIWSQLTTCKCQKLNAGGQQPTPLTHVVYSGDGFRPKEAPPSFVEVGPVF